MPRCLSALIIIAFTLPATSGASRRSWLRGKLRSESNARAIIAGPVWRKDGRALAYARRGPLGLTIIVKTESSRVPLVRHVPRTFGGRAHIFWVGHSQVAVGPSKLRPKVVISWEDVHVSRSQSAHP